MSELQNILDRSTPFYQNSRFGKYPTSKEIKFLHKKYTLDVIVDLTEEKEKPPYKIPKDVLHLKFPIKDHSVPSDSQKDDFLFLVRSLSEKLDSKTLYVHCRGGHGRSSLVVACILKYKYSLTSTETLKMITDLHAQRKSKESDYFLSQPQIDYIQNFKRY